MMGVITVFLTVSFLTFLGAVGTLGGVAVLKNAIYSVGDADIIIRAHTESTPWKLGNTNYYNDENEFFNNPY
jgi:hypothetical protein